MAIKLEDCKQITSAEYQNLKEPVFKAQTILNDNNEYWMVFESEENLYKTLNKKDFKPY